MAEGHVTIPLMVKTGDIKFVEEDYDTISDNEPSIEVTHNSSAVHTYDEISDRNSKVDYLNVPKVSLSRSTSTESSGAASPMLERKSSSRKKINHDYEKLSMTSNASKKSAVERLAESTFFRRRIDTAHERRSDSKPEEEENVLEVLRQVVRKCTNMDPVKRPTSKDVLDLMSNLHQKS